MQTAPPTHPLWRVSQKYWDYISFRLNPFKRQFFLTAVKDEDEESDLPFNGGPKLNRGISINLKSLINSPAAESPPPSPPKGTTAPHSSPVNNKTVSAASKKSPDAAAAGAASHQSGASKVALVDYPDEDSDEDADNTENGVAAKRVKLETS